MRGNLSHHTDGLKTPLAAFKGKSGVFDVIEKFSSELDVDAVASVHTYA